MKQLSSIIQLSPMCLVMAEVQQPERAQRRAIVSGVFVAAAGLIAALALVYSNATGVIEVAEDARHQQQAESALGSVTSARNTIGQTLLISGTTDDPTLVALPAQSLDGSEASEGGSDDGNGLSCPKPKIDVP